MVKDVTIATFNVLNLAAVDQKMYPSSRPLTQETFDKKVRWIGDKLASLDADIIGFQEVWSREALIACFRAAGLENDYTIVARDGPPGLVQVAAAVRKPLQVLPGDGTPWIENFPAEARLIKRPPKEGEPLDTMTVTISQFSRPVLALSIKMDREVTLRFYVIHMKSKRPTDLDRPEFQDPAVKPHAIPLGEALSAIRRTAETTALRVLLNKELTDNRMPAVVVGDLNDGHLSTTAGILSAQPPMRLFAASRVGSRPTKGGDKGLYSAQLLQQYRSVRDVYYTYTYMNILESLDHVFVSEEFYEHSPFRLWTFREMRVLNDHIHHRKKEDRVTSDHGIIVVEFGRVSPRLAGV